MKSTLKRTDDGTIELAVTVPWSEVQATYKTVVDETAAHTEIAGFRKGKAPKKMVEEKIDSSKAYEEAIKRIIPKAYSEALKEHALHPIMMPQISLKSAEEGKDWEVVAKTCEKPDVKLGDYKNAVGALKSSKVKKIIIPGKEEEQKTPKGPSVEEVLEALLSEAKLSVPGILIEHEVTHQLSQLVDQTKRLGLTVEQYLASTNKTTESVRKEYADIAEKNLKLEFILEAIADAEKVAVGDDEIEKILSSAKTPEERKNMENQRYYLVSLVRRQKTLDRLIGA